MTIVDENPILIMNQLLLDNVIVMILNFEIVIGSQSGPQDDYSGHDWSSVNNVSASDCVSLSKTIQTDMRKILSYYQNTNFPMTIKN